MIAKQRAGTILAEMQKSEVLVVGDLFLDEYLIGRAERLSREGPVPVLAFDRRSIAPGGGANPARNAAVLGASTAQVGVIGDDQAGAELRAELEHASVDTAGIVVDSTRPTIVKTRVVAEGLSSPQQVARIDRLDRRPFSDAIVSSLVRSVLEGAAGRNVVIVSHYRCGVVSDAVIDAARGARGANSVLCADAQGDLELFHGFDIVRIGRADAQRALGRELDDEASVQAATLEVRRTLGAGLVLLGRGALGTSVADDDGYSLIPPLNVSEVYDVSGAGDTMIAVSALALGAGASHREAVDLAQAGAASSIRRLGVAAPSATEIVVEIERASGA